MLNTLALCLDIWFWMSVPNLLFWISIVFFFFFHIKVWSVTAVFICVNYSCNYMWYILLQTNLKIKHKKFLYKFAERYTFPSSGKNCRNIWARSIWQDNTCTSCSQRSSKAWRCTMILLFKLSVCLFALFWCYSQLFLAIYIIYC